MPRCHSGVSCACSFCVFRPARSFPTSPLLPHRAEWAPFLPFHRVSPPFGHPGRRLPCGCHVFGVLSSGPLGPSDTHHSFPPRRPRFFHLRFCDLVPLAEGQRCRRCHRGRPLPFHRKRHGVPLRFSFLFPPPPHGERCWTYGGRDQLSVIGTACGRKRRGTMEVGIQKKRKKKMDHFAVGR